MKEKHNIGWEIIQVPINLDKKRPEMAINFGRLCRSIKNDNFITFWPKAFKDPVPFVVGARFVERSEEWA